MHATQFIGYLLSAIGLLTGGIGYYGKARGDSIIAYQSKENAALKEYNQTLETEKATLVAQRDSLQRENKTLQGLAQGAPQLTKLTAEMKNLTQAVTEQTAMVSNIIAKGKI